MSAGVVRRGKTVRRPVGPWTPTVHAYLGHLQVSGFAGAPRVIAVEGDVEVLTFLDGDVASDPDWDPAHGQRLPEFARSEQALEGAGRLLAQLHRAARGWDPPLPRFRFHPHPRLPGEVVTHGDLGPWNTVYRDGHPAAFIDWDSIQPLDPLVDVAQAAWAFVPLAPAQRLIEAGFSETADLGWRLRCFASAYGLERPAELLPVLLRAQLLAAERLRYFPIGPEAIADKLGHIADDLRWLAEVSGELEAALA